MFLIFWSTNFTVKCESNQDSENHRMLLWKYGIVRNLYSFFFADVVPDILNLARNQLQLRREKIAGFAKLECIQFSKLNIFYLFCYIFSLGSHSIYSLTNRKTLNSSTVIFIQVVQLSYSVRMLCSTLFCALPFIFFLLSFSLLDLVYLQLSSIRVLYAIQAYFDR